MVATSNLRTTASYKKHKRHKKKETKNYKQNKTNKHLHFSLQHAHITTINECRNHGGHLEPKQGRQRAGQVCSSFVSLTNIYNNNARLQILK